MRDQRSAVDIERSGFIPIGSPHHPRSNSRLPARCLLAGSRPPCQRSTSLGWITRRDTLDPLQATASTREPRPSSLAARPRPPRVVCLLSRSPQMRRAIWQSPVRNSSRSGHLRRSWTTRSRASNSGTISWFVDDGSRVWALIPSLGEWWRFSGFRFVDRPARVRRDGEQNADGVVRC